MTIYVRLIAVLFLFFVSFFCLSETTTYNPQLVVKYNDIYLSGQAACSASVASYAGWIGTWHAPNACHQGTSSNLDLVIVYYEPVNTYVCNSGDTLSALNGVPICYTNATCPVGTERDPNTGQCVPICELPMTKHPITGNCQLPICKDMEETPLDALCRFEDSKGTAMNCTDGSTIYAPQICPPNWIDRYAINPGNTAIQCDDGTFAAVGSSCYAHFLKMLFNNDPNALKGIAFGVGTSNLISVNPVGFGLPKFTLSPNSPNGLLANFPMLRLNAPTSSFFNIASTVPFPALGKALSDFFKAEPTAPYVSQFKQNASNIGFPVVINPNTGVVSPASSSVALSPNQLAQVAIKMTEPVTWRNLINPVVPMALPVQQLSNYLTPTDYPWMLPGLHGIEADMNRVYSPTLLQNPVNFSQIVPSSPYISSMPIIFPLTAPIISTTPNTTTSILTNPVNYNTYDYTDNISNFFQNSPMTATSTAPLVTFTPETAPQTYITYNNVSNTTITNINTNTNPTNTDALITPIQTPTQPTAIDPNTPDSLPVPPTLYPDTWKYFDFLPMANPFSFNISAYLPQIPQTSCYYEIHRVIFGFSFDFAPCVPLQPLRAVLQWAFAVLTAWACFLLIFRSQI